MSICVYLYLYKTVHNFSVLYGYTYLVLCEIPILVGLDHFTTSEMDPAFKNRNYDRTNVLSDVSAFSVLLINLTQ